MHLISQAFVSESADYFGTNDVLNEATLDHRTESLEDRKLRLARYLPPSS